MKVIALSCSPSRNRNSDTMLDSFIDGMKVIPNIEVEKIYLDDIFIENYSLKNSLGTSINENDFKILTNKISNDISGLVISTPTYNFSVPAHLKNFIDRIRFISLDLSIKNKFGQPKGKLSHVGTYFIVSGGTPNWAETILFFTFPAFWLRGVFLYFGAQVFGAFYSGNTESYKNNAILEKCYKKGKKFARIIYRNENHGILERIFFRPPQN